MTKLIFACLAYALVSVGAVLATGSTASAQSAVLSDMYGRGVHQYYAGHYREAYELLSSAINNGIEDPRAYYFRGIVARASGRPEQAKSDWQVGAQLEAAGKIEGPIGDALSRYQGPGRLELENIRQQARLQALATASERARQRYGGSQTQPAAPLPSRAQPAIPGRAPAGEGQAQQPAQPQAPSDVMPPPTPPAAGDDNPFADDVGQPEVESEDALQQAMEAAPTETPADGNAQGDAGAAGDDPFGAGDAPAGDDDPFGDDSGDAGSDPFGAGGGDDPFGGAGGGDNMDDPFGAGGGETDAPFGG